MTARRIRGTISVAATGVLVTAWFATATSSAPLRSVATPAQALPASSIRATGLDGRSCALPALQARATVLIFVLHDCPVCNRYAPEINRIAADYRKRAVECFVVYEERDLTRAQALRHAGAYGLKTGLLYDPAHALARRVGATATPEAVLLEPDGSAVYHGRIDDTFRHFGMAAPEPSTRDLRNALNELLIGKPVSTARTPVVGCAIPRD